ncbi:FAD/NAD(P)-binding domain-containing protein [Aspergillus heterothallicus]
MLAAATATANIRSITADVCILGGGGTGAYAAVQLLARGNTVVIVEKEARLGGHSQTLYLDDGGLIDYGVRGYFNTEIVRAFFDQVGAPYKNYTAPSSVYDYVDFRTGRRVPPPSAANASDALARYDTAIRQFPFLSAGVYDLPDEVPEALLCPFREFVEAYGLEGILGTVQMFAEPVRDLLAAPLLYVLQDFGISHLEGLRRGGGIVPVNGTQELFRRVTRVIGEDRILLNSTVSRVMRNISGAVVFAAGGCGKRTAIEAKNVLVTFPPTLENMRVFDLDEDEQTLFSKWRHTSYYAAVIGNTSIPDGLGLINASPDNQPGGLPLPPFEFLLQYSGIKGYHTTRIVGDANFTEEEARRMLLGDISRMGQAGTFPVDQQPTMAAFASHSPEAMMVSVDDIRNGFYKKLYALQGNRNTYYTGLAFCTDYSPQLWNYTLGVVDLMNSKRGL